LSVSADTQDTVTGVRDVRKLLDEGQGRDNVGLLLRGVEKTELLRGMVVCQPGSITPHTKLWLRSTWLTSKGRWREKPFLQRLLPTVLLRNTDVTGTIKYLKEPRWSCRRQYYMEVYLFQPIAIEETLRSPSGKGADHRLGCRHQSQRISKAPTCYQGDTRWL